MTKDQYNQLKPGDKVILNERDYYDDIPKGELLIHSLSDGYIRIETVTGKIAGWHFNIFAVVHAIKDGWETP